MEAQRSKEELEIQEREKLYKEKRLGIRRKVAQALKNFGGPKSPSQTENLSIGERSKFNKERLLKRTAIRIGRYKEMRDKRL
jgi:hypothetical protein